MAPSGSDPSEIIQTTLSEKRPFLRNGPPWQPIVNAQDRIGQLRAPVTPSYAREVGVDFSFNCVMQ
jgi:hypothetical protein